MRIRRFVVAVAALLCLGGGIVAAPPSQACLVPCNATPKAMGSLLGGGIPANSFGFDLNGKFRGYDGLKVKTEQFHAHVGGYAADYCDYEYDYYCGSTPITLGSRTVYGTVDIEYIPAMDGPQIGLITIGPGPDNSHYFMGHLIGLVGGDQTVGELEYYGAG